MKRLLSILPMLACIIGCHAHLDMRVDVYRGPTWSTTQEPSLDQIVDSASRIAAACEGSASALASTADSAMGDVGNLADSIDAKQAKLLKLGLTSEFSAAAKTYVTVYQAGFADLKAAGLAPDDEKVQKSREALNKLADAAANATVTLEGEPLARPLAGRLGAWVRDATGNPDAADLVKEVTEATACDAAESACKKRRDQTAKTVVEKSALVLKIAEAFPSDPASVNLSLKGLSIKIQPAARIMHALQELKKVVAAGGMSGALAGVQAAVSAVREKATEFRGTASADPPRVRLAGELAALLRASRTVREEGAKLEPAWDEASASSKILREQIEGAAPAAAANFRAILAELDRKIDKLADMLLTLGNQNSEQAFAPKPFRETDPNLKILAHPGYEPYWVGTALDTLAADADGTSQFVVVQETPVNFKLKRLHADPSKSAELAMSVAEVGFNVLSEVVLNGASLPGQTETGSTPAAAQGSEKREAASAAADVCRGGVRDLVSKLRAELSLLKPTLAPGAAKKANIDTDQLARIQGIFRGHIALLKSCAAELGQAEAGQDPKPDHAAPESGGTGADAQNPPEGG